MTSDDAAHLDLVVRLGRELVKLGLASQAAHLREYYSTVRAGREPGTWSRDMVLDWARDLRLPPHEHDTPVRARGSSCGCPSPTSYTARVWPGGARHTCTACRGTWIELG